MPNTLLQAKSSPFPNIDDMEARIFDEAEDEDLHPAPNSVRTLRAYIKHAATPSKMSRKRVLADS